MYSMASLVPLDHKETRAIRGVQDRRASQARLGRQVRRDRPENVERRGLAANAVIRANRDRPVPMALKASLVLRGRPALVASRVRVA